MFATGPRAVGFTIVCPEGVIFRSMMTYHAQFLLLVVAGWVNRQQQDVIDSLQEENRVLVWSKYSNAQWISSLHLTAWRVAKFLPSGSRMSILTSRP